MRSNPHRTLSALAIGTLMCMAFPAFANDAEGWTKTRLLLEKNWNPEKLKEASEADPPGSLFESFKDGRGYMNTAVMVNRGCEQVWYEVDLEDDEKLSMLFGKTIVTTKREKTDDGYEIIAHEQAMGFKSDEMPMVYTLEEGDPNHRIVYLESKDPEMWVEGKYEFISVGSPEHCIFSMKMGVEFPSWVPEWLFRWIMDLGADRLSGSFREGILKESMWTADKEGPIRTEKGKRDRAAFLAKQNPKAQMAVPVQGAVLDAAPQVNAAAPESDAPESDAPESDEPKSDAGVAPLSHGSSSP